MSNHHPGNEWYRRLIRSNRPLYRACPKHTKLLVSKAIVQAVEQQGGRFLEHDKKSGLWYVVPYKRAVDKTSQGLRERDRENDDDDGREMDPAHVPESFQGRHNAGPTNLNDLAAVAVAHANGNQAYSQWNQRSTAPMAANKRPLGDSAPSASYESKRVRMDVYPAPVVSEVPQPTTLEARQSSIFRLMKQSQWLSGIKGGWTGEFSTPAATPVSMPAPQVSTNTYPTKLNNLRMAQTVRGDAEPSVALHAKSQPELTELSISASLFTPSMFLEAQPSQSMTGPTGPRGGIGVGNHSPVPAPPLSRLTTQISDWLFSFWPLQGKAEAERTGRAGYPSDPLEGDPFESESPEPSERQVREQRLSFQSTTTAPTLNSRVTPASDRMSSFLPDGRTVPFPNSRLPPSIQQQIKIPAPFNLDEQKPVITTVPPPVRNHNVPQAHSYPSANRVDKRKHRSSFPALPYDLGHKDSEPNLGGPLDGSVRMNTRAIPLKPTFPPPHAMHAPNPPVSNPPAPQLEPSISTSLFKLASSPSRLLAGITSFFERPTASGVGGVSVSGNTASAEAGIGGISQGLPTFTSMGTEPSASDNMYPQATQGSAMPRRASKSTKSLLDDDEDTPMEARLRALPAPTLQSSNNK
jgi:hypothetical protein